MVGDRLALSTVAPWWSVCHQITEKWTMGTSTNATSAATAHRLARTSGVAGTRRSARYPRNSTNSSAVEVSRASQVHHTPQVGRPHSIPVARVSALNTTPTSTDAAASRSQNSERVRRHRYSRLLSAASPNARQRATHAIGGCRYTRRTRLPWTLSGGVTHKPSHTVSALSTAPRAPVARIQRGSRSGVLDRAFIRPPAAGRRGPPPPPGRPRQTDPRPAATKPQPRASRPAPPPRPGRTSRGSRVSRTRSPADRAPYRVPATARPHVARSEATKASHPTRRCTPNSRVIAAHKTTWSTASSTATAAALPRNTPAGSMPDDRRPPRVPSPDSMATLRWVASTVENKTASQNSPGAAPDSALRPGPRANPSRTSDRTATGTTCHRATLER